MCLFYSNEGYMCATPLTTLDSDYNNELYDNIFNIVIESDIVSTVAPALEEYLSSRYGVEIYREAIAAGVFSQSEYYEKIEIISVLLERKIIDLDTFYMCEKVIDTYYGIRILAVHYGIDADIVKNTTKRLGGNLVDLVKLIRPLKTATYCKYNHFGEFYKAWLDNYNPYTKEVIE